MGGISLPIGGGEPGLQGIPFAIGRGSLQSLGFYGGYYVMVDIRYAYALYRCGEYV